MHRSKSLTLSIVIPVYNEERYIKACLEAIATQTVKPLEVIVIDNNSTDKSREIAAQYPFVTLLHEKQQGQVFAQATGFDGAKGSILGRIDADTLLPPNWVDAVTKQFTNNPNMAALTGGADPYDVANKWVNRNVFYLYHEYVAGLFWRQHLLWGSNTAFRAKHWPYLKKHMNFTAKIWEDYEMSYWLAQCGQIVFQPTITVGCSFRAAHQSFVGQLKYQYRNIRTYRLHHSAFLSGLYFIVWYSMVPLFPFAIADNYLARNKSKREL